MIDVVNQAPVAKEVYTTPVRRGTQANSASQNMRTPNPTKRNDTDREMLLQVTASGTRLSAGDPRVMNNRKGASQILVTSVTK